MSASLFVMADMQSVRNSSRTLVPACSNSSSPTATMHPKASLVMVMFMRVL